jgi:hypothetical protein
MQSVREVSCAGQYHGYDTIVPDAHLDWSDSLFNKDACAHGIAKLINVAPLLLQELGPLFSH